MECDRTRGAFAGMIARIQQKGFVMTKLVLLRHGQSTWNQENRFTSWTDVDLAEQG